jgi:Protein of unknown function (DUF998)
MAQVTVIAQVVFVLSWLIAGLWQGPNYNAASQTISDMYAETAPNALFLVVAFTLCGLATVLFAALSVWPALSRAGWLGIAGSILLGLSVAGLGTLLTPFERPACRIADAGCSEAAQLTNMGGKLDALLSTLGVLAFLAAVFVIAAAMTRTVEWRAWAWPTRWVGIAFILIFIADVATAPLGFGGLVQRLFAAFGAAAVGIFAWRIANMSAHRTAGSGASSVGS